MIIFILGIGCAAQSLAQSCNDAIAQTTFSERFDISLADPSFATDLATSLEWQRCPAGLVFNDQGDAADISIHTCDTPPELTDDDPETIVLTLFNWIQAINRAAEEGGEWRLPNVKELATIVEHGCAIPAINTEVFPGTTSVGYWASTPSADTDSSAWTVNFNDGSNITVTKSTPLSIRLVRDTD